MTFLLSLLFVFSFLTNSEIDGCNQNVFNSVPRPPQGLSGTCTWSFFELPKLLLSSCVPTENQYNLLPLMSLYIFDKCFIHAGTSTKEIPNSNEDKTVSKSIIRKKFIILLLLLLSGNVESNPGPQLDHIDSPDEFRTRSGLGIIHINARSMLPKLDMIKIWLLTFLCSLRHG